MIAFLFALALFQSNPPAGRAERGEAVRAVLERHLLDYESGRFQNVRTVRRAEIPHVTVAACGTVNSRTSAGGYAGWTEFVVLNDDLYMADSSIGRRAWRAWCDGPSTETIDPDITEAVSPPRSSE